MLFRVCRDNHYFNVRVTPIEAKSGKYAIGVWVKDDISGIGTITYIEDGQFAALGHSINDNDTGITFRVSDGALYETTIVRIRKPEAQTPGRLEGVINYAAPILSGEWRITMLTASMDISRKGSRASHGCTESSGRNKRRGAYR